MVVLGFPSYHCSLLDWTSYSFFRFRGQRLTKMWLPDLLFARPVATSGWSEVLASAVKATEGALLTPSACTNSGQWDSLPELGRLLWNPAQDWGWWLPLWACHLQIEQPESYSAHSHSLNSTCAKLLTTKKLQGYFVVVVVVFCFF